MEEISRKFNLMLQGRPRVQKAFLEARLCYVIGGLRNLHVKQVVENRSGLISEIAKNISPFPGLPRSQVAKRHLVGCCLVILAPEHLRCLLTPTLASLPPFTPS